MLHGKEAESEATVGGKPSLRVSLQEYPTGPVGRFYWKIWRRVSLLKIHGQMLIGRRAASEASVGRKP
jgi:hypothetical protein